MNRLIEKCEQIHYELRKQNLQEIIAKRRLESLSSLQRLTFGEVQCAIIEFLQDSCFQNLQRIKKMSLSMDTLKIISGNNEVIQRTCQFMRQEFDETAFQFEASWILANVTVCRSSYDTLAQLGIEKFLLRRLSAQGNMSVHENCLWCFNNILIDDCPLKSWLIQNNILDCLEQMLKQSPTFPQLQNIITTIMRLAQPPYSYCKFRRFHRILLQMIHMSDVAQNSLAISCLSKFMVLDMHQILIADLYQSRAIVRLISLIEKIQDAHVIYNLAYIIGNFCSNTTNIRQLLNSGIFYALDETLKRKLPIRVKEEVLWAVFAIISNSKFQQQVYNEVCKKLMSTRLIRTVIGIYKNSGSENLQNTALKILTICSENNPQMARVLTDLVQECIKQEEVLTASMDNMCLVEEETSEL